MTLKNQKNNETYDIIILNPRKMTKKFLLGKIKLSNVRQTNNKTQTIDSRRVKILTVIFQSKPI